MQFEQTIKKFHTVREELSARKQEHLASVHETPAQHRKVALGFARRFIGLSLRSLQQELCGKPIENTPVGKEILVLAENLAARNPPAVKKALAMTPPLRKGRVWACMMAAASCTFCHAIHAGLWTDGGSKRAIRAALALGLKTSDFTDPR